MTQAELYALLNSTGYDTAHIEFSKPPKTPYIAYMYGSEKQRGGDSGNNSISEATVTVELYTEYGDKAAEPKLDTALSFAEFEKSKEKISEEKLILITYTFNIIIKI